MKVVFGCRSITRLSAASSSSRFGKLRPVKAPVGTAVQLFPAFVRLVDRQEERGRVGDVNQHRQAQLAAGLPDAVPPRIVDLDQRAVRVFVFQAELLEDLHAAGAALFRRGQLARHAAGEIGPVAVPRGRIVGLAGRLASRCSQRSRTGPCASSTGASRARRTARPTGRRG